MKGPLEARLAELDRLYPVWTPRTIWGFFEASADRAPERPLVVLDGQETYTYGQAREISLRFAETLYAYGVRPGDHVALQLGGSADQIFLALALARLRAVKVPVNGALGSCELNYVLGQSRSRFLLTDRRLELSGEHCRLDHIFTLNGGSCVTDLPVSPWPSAQAGSGTQPLPVWPDEAFADQVSDIIYTSGSTSAPKGVMLTHDMLMRSAFASCRSRGFELGRRIFVPLPMFHVYGYVEGLLAVILVGGAVLLWNRKFSGEQAVRFMREACANDILCVPAQAMALIQYLDGAPCDLPDLHAVYCSAAVCPAWVWPGIRSALGVSDVITGYGMTEVCGASMQTAPTDTDHILETRVGRLLPGGCAGVPEYGGHQIQYRVVDPATGADCPAGSSGELWCRGPVVTKGYFDRPEINRRSFTPDGWFRTGDCGRFDRDGYLLLDGRMDDIYKINGENVSPKYLEDILSTCPLVRNVEIVGIPDEKHGAVGAAFVQLREDTAEHREAVLRFCQDHLAKFQIPKYFIYMKDSDWPRTSTGKVQKFRLREIAAAYSRGQGPSAQSEGIA